MSQNQHVLSQVYLRQWCGEDGRLIRVQRVGHDGRLEIARKAPRGVAFEPDLYTLPEGGIANGLAREQLETKLAREVDEKLPRIVERASSATGILAAGLGEEVRWLIRTFAARHPAALRRAEDAAASTIDAQRGVIESMLTRAGSAEGSAELYQFLDARMPAVAARAALAAIIDGVIPPAAPSGERPLESDAHVIRLDDLARDFPALGIEEFATYDDPVLEWVPSPSGLVATFALSPLALAAIYEVGAIPSRQDYLAAAIHHVVSGPSSRHTVFCRHPPSGALREAAGTLVPKVPKNRR